MVLADDGVATGGMAVMVAVAAEMANAVFWCSPEVTGWALDTSVGENRSF